MQKRFKKITLLLTFLCLAESAQAIHPAQFSDQISAMLRDAGLYPSLEVELDFMFDRRTLRTTQRKLQQVRLARKHGASELAETARKNFFAGRRLVTEARWEASDALEADETEAIVQAIATIKEKIAALEELKTNFYETVDQWSKLEKEWTLMTNNDFVNFAENSFFRLVHRKIYEAKDKEDPRLVPSLVDDLNYFIAEAGKCIGYLKHKLKEI